MNFWNRFFQFGILLFLLAGYIFFALEEMKTLPIPENSSSQEEPVENIIESIHFSPSPFLDHDFRWHLIKTDSEPINFNGFDENYCENEDDILCFRGNHRRNAPTRGTLNSQPKSIKLDWIFKTRKDTGNTRFGKWGGGTGWTGQPLVIQWPSEMKQKLNIIDPNFINNRNAREIIIGSLSGEVYFLNMETGDSTRHSLHLDGPIKGTPSVDPRLNGLLYVGQGIDKGLRFGSYVIDMTKNEVIFHQSGKDQDAYRKWGAFDSNPLIDRKSGSVFWPSENGLIYSINSSNPSKINIASKWKYTNNNMMRHGLESSMAVDGKFGFFADNSGNVFCMDLINQIPIWNQKNEDDTDATIVLDKEENQQYLYVGNEVDFRGPEAISSFRKLDAKNGKEIWNIQRLCRGTPIADKTNSGGILATPLLGKKNCKELVYVIFSRMNEKNQSELIAINKKTGKEVFSYLMKAYSWASPIDLYDKQGNMYLFFTDVRGSIYLLNGKTGEVIYQEKTNYTFESSPIAIDNRIVVGVRGNKILSFLVE
ncbi:MAG: PQQ-like beta-propeller repeat protein [Crocinitomicaceae bacterium]|nr:PQQ-like beta-propeller repeat protein [Crocinitomicaceae bacterium]